jgi:hypothetical protein
MLRSRRLISAFLLFTFVCGFSGIVFAQDDGPDLDIKSVSIGDLGAMAPGQVSPTGGGRPPRVGPNLRANAAQQPFPDGLLGRSETTVAATADAQSIIVGFNDAQGFCGAPFGVACTPQTPSGLSGFAFSTDAGLSFTDAGAPDPALSPGGNVFTRGDPWLDRGGSDNLTFFYANLSVDATTGADLGASVHRGHFDGLGGFAFQDVRTFNAPNAPHDFYDKEAIAAAKDGSGSAYVSLTNFIEVCNVPQAGSGQIEVWRTHDSGDTWQGPTIVSPDTTTPNNPADPNCGATQILQQSSAPAIGPNGEVYVVFQFGPTFSPAGTSTNANIFFARSLDGGVTFSTPASVAAINSMRQDAPVGYNRDRLNDHPRVAVATSGPFKGRVYVTFYSAVDPVTAGALSPCPNPPGGTCRAQRLTSSNVFVTFSDDMGATWSAPVAVGGLLAPGSTGLKRWWPVVNVEPSGTVDVVYYESQEVPVGSNPFCTISVGGGIRRRGPANSLVNTMWAQSVNGGASFQGAPFPLTMSSATTNWCTTASNIRPNFGDYIGASFGGNRVLATWGDGRNGVPDTFYATGLGAGKSK